MEIHLILQNLLLIVWAYVIYLLIGNKQQMSLNIFGVMLASSILMIYMVASGMFAEFVNDGNIWNRWEWYVVDFLFALTYVKVINMARKINIMLNLFSKKKK